MRGRTASKTRLGLTLVELLAVIAIVGVLAALLLPAVQQAREAARRIQCASRLRQVGLALSNYESTFRRFPGTAVGPGRVSHHSCTTGYYSWQASILPYLDHQSVYDLIDWRVNMADKCEFDALEDGRIGLVHTNASAASAKLPVLLCPSDPSAQWTNEIMGDSQPGLCSYAGNIGWPPFSSGIDGDRLAPTNDNGFFGYRSDFQSTTFLAGRTRIVDFTDGLSNTVAVTERLIQPMNDFSDPLEVRDVRLISFCAMGYSTIRPMQDYLECTSTHMFVDPIYSLPIGRAWISGWAPVGNVYLQVIPPNQSNCHLMGGEGLGGHLASPSSNHPGGVHVLYGDSRVTFQAESVDVRTWWLLGSRNDGEVVAKSE